MKSDFKYIEDEMNSLGESMVEIRLFSSEIDNELRDIRKSTRKLMTTADNLQKVVILQNLKIFLLVRIFIFLTLKNSTIFREGGMVKCCGCLYQSEGFL